MNKTELKEHIGSTIVENDTGEITAEVLTGVLGEIIDCTEIGGSQTTISGISGQITNLNAGELNVDCINVSGNMYSPYYSFCASNDSNVKTNSFISVETGDTSSDEKMIFTVDDTPQLQIQNYKLNNDNYSGYIDFKSGNISGFNNINVYNNIKGLRIEGSTIYFDAVGTGTINLLSVLGDSNVSLSKENIISIYKTGSYTGELTIRTDKLMPFGSNFYIGDSSHRAKLYTDYIDISSNNRHAWLTADGLFLNSVMSIELHSKTGNIRNYYSNAEIILSNNTGSSIITGFDSINMANSGQISGNYLHLDLGSGSITGVSKLDFVGDLYNPAINIVTTSGQVRIGNIKITGDGVISGATGKYINLADGTISGFTIPTIIPNDITVQSITGVKTISGDNLIIDNLYSINGNSNGEILLDANYVTCTNNFTVDGKLRVRDIISPNEGFENINIYENVNFNKNINLAMNSVIEFATGDGGGIINNVKEITNDRDIDIITTGSAIGLNAYSVNINSAIFKRVSETIALADIKSINTIMSNKEIYGDIKIDFPNKVITGFTTINDITNLSLSTIDQGSINVGKGSINVGNGSINVTVGSINMTNGSLNMNNATINTNANINISGAGKLIIGTLAIGESELQILLENAGIPLS